MSFRRKSRDKSWETFNSLLDGLDRFVATFRTLLDVLWKVVVLWDLDQAEILLREWFSTKRRG